MSLGCAFFLSGCVIDEALVVNPEPGYDDQAEDENSDDSTQRHYSPQRHKWDKFSFRALTGEEDLTVTKREAQKEGDLAVVVYTTDCEVCKQHAPLLDQMVKELPRRNVEGEGTDFIIIFADVSAGDENPNVDWVENLANVDAYSNVATACEGGACRQVFWPTLVNFSSGAVLYYVDKENVMNTRRGRIWTEETLDYEAMKTEAAGFMKLDAIKFDAGVQDMGEG